MLSLSRKGSVIADIELTFNEAVGESEVHSLLSEAIKDGTLGQLQVDQEIVVGPTILVGTTILGEHNLNVNVYCILIYLS